jgi:N-terminal half of MaoC dehydratase
MSARSSCLSDAMRGAVGRRLSRRVSFPVSRSDIRRWALAVYYPEPPPREFVDADYAATRWGGLVAPQEFNPFAWLVAEQQGPDVRVAYDDPDLTEIVLGVEGPHLKFQLNGGLHAEYGLPMRPGDVITSVNRLAEYREREGRLGLMLFTVTEDEWTNQNGDRVKCTRETLIRY